jgi:hypothetical protein
MQVSPGCALLCREIASVVDVPEDRLQEESSDNYRAQDRVGIVMQLFVGY